MKRTTRYMLGAIFACGQLLALAGLRSGAASAAGAPPACTMAALTPAIAEDSPGMGRLGIDLTLTNHGAAGCVLGPVLIGFLHMNPDHLFGVHESVSGSHLLLAPGAAGVTHVVWSDGIGGNGPCADATSVAVFTGPPGPAPSLPIRAHICALNTAKPSFTAQPFSLKKR